MTLQFILVVLHLLVDFQRFVQVNISGIHDYLPWRIYMALLIAQVVSHIDRLKNLALVLWHS